MLSPKKRSLLGEGIAKKEDSAKLNHFQFDWIICGKETNTVNEPQETKDQVALPKQGTLKKPYEKPQITYRAPLEAMASACNPIQGGKGQLTCVPPTRWPFS